jgi:hypothetical protein
LNGKLNIIKVFALECPRAYFEKNGLSLVLHAFNDTDYKMNLTYIIDCALLPGLGVKSILFYHNNTNGTDPYTILDARR